MSVMKKIAALLTAVAVLLAAVPAFAANEAEDVLKIVKGKIDIPEEMEEFNYSSNTWDGELSYNFYWSGDSKSASISADKDGNIKSYDFYDESFYTDEKKTIIRASESDAKKTAEEFIKRALPEMFVNEDDILLADDSETSVYNSGTSKRFTFIFKRYYKGTYVYGNDASVTVYASNSVMTVTQMSASIDLSAAFDEGERITLTREDYEKEFTPKLYYKSYYTDGKNNVKLVYTIEKGFISEKDGQRAESAGSNDKFSFNAPAETSDMSAGGGRKVELTPQETEELANMGALLTKEELEAKLRGMEELKITDDMKLSYSYTYKSAESYYISLTLSDESENGTERSIYVYFNASTGEILSIYNSDYSSESGKLTDEENVKCREKAKAFMNKLEPEKMKEVSLEEIDNSVNGKRTVNGVEYPANSISCVYSGDMVSSYSIDWDEDVSSFTDPKNAIGEAAAYEALFKATDFQHIWLNTKDGYIPAVTIGKAVTLDAVTGEDMNKKKAANAEYSDIKGHWAENMINALAEQGIYLEGDTFRPDENITQGDMLRLFGSLFYYPSFARSSLDYDWLIKYKGVVTKEEADENKTVTREEAFNIFVKMMGAGEIAELDIFKPTFTDADSFEKGYGSAEILKAMGVISGETARPGDMLTRAEAVSVIYRYLDR